MGDGEDSMVVCDPFNQLRITFHNPFLLHWGLAAWAMAVIAGTGMDLDVPAFFAVALVIAKVPSLAECNAVGSFPLLQCGGMRFQVFRQEALEDIPDREIFCISRSHKGFLHSFPFRCQASGRFLWMRGIYAPSLL